MVVKTVGGQDRNLPNIGHRAMEKTPMLNGNAASSSQINKAFSKFDIQAEKVIKSNKLSYLLERHDNPWRLKDLLVRSVLENNKGKKSDSKIADLERAFSFLEEYYGGAYRRDGKTPAVCHPFSVALGISRLGCNLETVFTAMLHDVLEDKFQKLTLQDFKEIFGDRLGKKTYFNVRLLTRKKNMRYDTYMDKITRSQKIDVMLVKAIDTIENLKTLSYLDNLISSINHSNPASSLEFLMQNPYTRMKIEHIRILKPKISVEQLLFNIEKDLAATKNRALDKALAHLEIWKKINSDLYLLIIGLFQGANPAMEHISRLEGFLYPSTRTVGYLDAGYANLTWRGELNRSLFWLLPDEGIPKHPEYNFGDLPDQGLPVITIYDPTQYQNVKYAKNMIEIEFPKRIEKRLIEEKMLEKHLSIIDGKWKRVKSILPRELECSVIFRAKRPHPANNAALLFDIKLMSFELFHKEQQQIIAELLAKSKTKQ